MTSQNKNEIEVLSPPPLSTSLANDSKVHVNHIEHDLEDVDVSKGLQERVVDSEAIGYTDSSMEIDEEENKRLRKIINFRILPLLCMVYLVQALDKGALGPISIMGWLDDVKAKGQDYAWTGTVLYIGFVIGEPIATQLIRKLPVAKILAVSMLGWTALSLGLAFSLTIPPILANRLLLGILESTFNPCLMTITVQWYRRSEQPWISAIWQSMTALATTISSIMAWGLYQVPYNGTGLRGWQWLLVFMTCVSAISTAVTLFFLPDSPTRARWANDDLKVKFVERVRSNNQGIKQKQWKSEQAWEALKDPFAYCLFSFALIQTIIVGGIGKFNSLLINQAFGFDVLTSQLLKVPLGITGVLFYYCMAFIVWKYNNTLFAMCGFATMNMAGTIVLITVTPSASTRGGLFAAFMIMQSFSACNTAMFLMLSRNVAGSTKKSILYGTTFMAWGAGNAISPQLFWNEWAPRYVPSLYMHLGLYGTFIMICLGARVLLVRRNKRKDDAQRDEFGNVITLNNHAFEDLTDLANPDFRYCL